jgi:uncharacterized membrane protein
VLEAGDEVIHSWAVSPASSDAGSGNRSELSYVVDAGGRIDDAVTVFNLGNVPLTFRVYATDAFNNAAGGFDLLPGDEPPRDVGAWVTVAQENVEVQPGQQITLPISIVVPSDARPGDHAGAIVASSQVLSTGDSGDLVAVDRRTGPRLFVRVNGPLRSELAITGLSVNYSPKVNPLSGATTVDYRIENRGNVRASGTHQIVVSGPFGIGEQRAQEGTFSELLPGEGIDVTATVDDVPALGMVDTDVVVDAAPDGAASDEPVTRSARSMALPVTVLLLVVLALLGGLARRAYRRHRSPTGSEPELVHPEVLEPEPEHQTT